MADAARLRFSLCALAGALFLTLGILAGDAAANSRSGHRHVPRIHLSQHREVASAPSSARCRARESRRRAREARRTRRLRLLARRAERRGRLREARRRRRTLRKRQELRRRSARASQLCAAPNPGATARQPSYKADPGSIYWGAWIGDQLTGEQAPWDMDAVAKLEQMAGKKLSIVHFGAPFANCYESCYFYDFPTNPMQSIRNHGSIPFLSWSSQSIPTHVDEPDYQLSDVAGGAYDDFIRDFAKDAAAWGHPFFLRFNWEMNGDWFPWEAGANGNDADDYIAAWRHVHDIFTSVGATNVSWVWCPNVDPGGSMVDLASLYPGDGYVDWTCLDGYNWGTNSGRDHRWVSFDRLFSSTYDRIVETIAPSKPMIIGETGASEFGGSKAEWIADMLRKIPTAYPKIRGLLYFERYDDGMDWPLESSPSATSAFAAGIQDPAYATNSFGDLSGSAPIPPPQG